MFPFEQDICSFDFKVASEDEYMCAFAPPLASLPGKTSGDNNNPTMEAAQENDPQQC